MEKINFSDCTLVRMERVFGLIPAEELYQLSSWIGTTFTISDFDSENVRRLCRTLKANVLHWNEYDLSLHFIGPMFSLVDFTERRRFNLFAQRTISAVVQGIELGGRTDELVASGYREPETPFFAINEYKKETDPDGDPAGQALAAMLVAQELNIQKGVDLPVYGCYVVGGLWRFMVLQGSEYAISQPLVSTEIEDAYQILRILFQLKIYCMERTEPM